MAYLTLLLKLSERLSEKIKVQRFSKSTSKFVVRNNDNIFTIQFKVYKLQCVRIMNILVKMEHVWTWIVSVMEKSIAMTSLMKLIANQLNLMQPT